MKSMEISQTSRRVLEHQNVENTERRAGCLVETLQGKPYGDRKYCIK